MKGSHLQHHIQTIADRSRLYSQRHFKLFGAITLVTLPLSTVLEKLVGDPDFNSFYIRALAGAAGLPLLFHERLPDWMQQHFEWVWIGLATFVLPFSFGLILTMNAAFAEPGATPSPIWVYQYLVALFIFIQLINHGPLSGSLWLMATGLVFITLTMVEAPNLAALKDTWLYPLPVYLTALIVGSITNRNVHVVQAEQLRAAAAIGTNIAHELRTPLASIRMLAHATERYLPSLADAYRKAQSAEIPVERISPTQLDQLSSGLASIQIEVGYSNTIIDMLLANTTERPTAVDRFEEFRIADAVGEAMDRFPFNNSGEKKLLSYTVHENFSVFAPKQLVVHVLFNLIKNALYFVQKSGEGRIELLATQQDGRGRVDVTDTGTGVPPNLQPRIFDRFFSSDPASQGAGIGLSFCKMVMESIGGDIRCESVPGEYTTFRLTFPRSEAQPDARESAPRGSCMPPPPPPSPTYRH